MHMAAPSISHEPEPGTLQSRRLHDASAGESDRNIAIAMHLTPLGSFIGFFPWALFVPLVLWLVRKKNSAFDDDHGREVINFGLTFILLNIILFISIIGWLLLIPYWIVAIISMIRGAIAGGRGEYFRYPLTWRFLS